LKKKIPPLLSAETSLLIEGRREGEAESYAFSYSAARDSSRRQSSQECQMIMVTSQANCPQLDTTDTNLSSSPCVVKMLWGSMDVLEGSCSPTLLRLRDWSTRAVGKKETLLIEKG
jgi:hypothetical protein